MGKAYSPNHGPSTLILRKVMAPIALEKVLSSAEVTLLTPPTCGAMMEIAESGRSNPGDRCSAGVPLGFRWGRGKSELRRAVCSLTARSRSGDGAATESATEKIPPMARPSGRAQVRVKWCGPSGLKVRAHRLRREAEGRENPTRSKTK